MELIPFASGAARRPGKIKNKIKASSSKLQAALTMDLGSCRMVLERNKYE